MIRKIVMATAIAVMPVASLAAVGLTSGVASAKGLPPAAASCVVGGSITFPNSGISAFGDTSKGGTSTVSLTSSSSDCSGTTSSVAIKTKSSKCSAPVTTASFTEVVGGTPIVLQPASNIYLPSAAGGTLPQCEQVPPKKPGGPDTVSKNDEADSAWGFAGGVAVDGVQSSTSSQLPAELKKGVPVKDGGTTYTLLVTAAGEISPGGVCGSDDVGFALSGDIKKYTTTSWSANVCLGADSATGTTAGTFLGDLTNLITGTASTTAGGAPLGSTPDTSITGATIDPAYSTLTITPPA